MKIVNAKVLQFVRTIVRLRNTGIATHQEVIRYVVHVIWNLVNIIDSISHFHILLKTLGRIDNLIIQCLFYYMIAIQRDIHAFEYNNRSLPVLRDNCKHRHGKQLTIIKMK